MMETNKSTDEIESMKGKKAVNYWWGMSADVIDVICSENMPNGTRRLIEFLKNSISISLQLRFTSLISRTVHQLLIVMYSFQQLFLRIMNSLLQAVML